MNQSSRLLFLWVTALVAGTMGCVPRNVVGRGARARGTESWSWRMKATEGTWKVDGKGKHGAAQATESEPGAEQAADDLEVPEQAPAPRAKKSAKVAKVAKVAKAAPAADASDAEMSFAPVRLTRAEPKPVAKPVARKAAPAPAPRPVAVARRTAPTRAVAADASFEEDEYLDELLGETGGGAKKKKAHEPVKSAEITMDADDVGDPEARERERDLARAKAAGEAAVARMKAKLAKQGFKAKDQGPVPDVVARPKKKVMVARVDEDEDEDEDEDAADQDEDEDDASADEDEDEDEDADEAPRAKKADRKVEKKVEKVEKVEKKAEKKAEKVEPESEPEPDKVASPRKKKAKGEFYASGEGFLAEDDGGGEPEAADDDDAADDEAADEDEPASAPRKSKKATKAKKSKKKSNRAARSSKRKSRGATKADRRSRKKSSDDDA